MMRANRVAIRALGSASLRQLMRVEIAAVLALGVMVPELLFAMFSHIPLAVWVGGECPASYF
jgi:hypothetical protein